MTTEWIKLTQDEIDHICTMLLQDYLVREGIDNKELAKKISLQAVGYDRNALGGGWLD